jgi:Sec7-like guanine-nucleotide exchange factor
MLLASAATAPPTLYISLLPTPTPIISSPYLYNQQNDFLKPFVGIMRSSPSAEIRELVIRSVSQMVLTKVASVKSGWKTVLQVSTNFSYTSRYHQYYYFVTG